MTLCLSTLCLLTYLINFISERLLVYIPLLKLIKIEIAIDSITQKVPIKKDNLARSTDIPMEFFGCGAVANHGTIASAIDAINAGMR